MPRTPATVRTSLIAAFLGALLASNAGCNVFAVPILLWGKEPTKTIPAEYPYLAGEKIAILVWAEDYTRFEFPRVEHEVAEHVRVAMKQHVRQVKFVPTEHLIAYQQRNPEWVRRHPAEVGQEFNADRVLLIELTQYTTREPASPHLRRGHMGANIKIYDVDYPNAGPSFKTAVSTPYPPDTFGAYGTDDNEIRRGMMQAFASKLAAHFYDREERVR